MFLKSKCWDTRNGQHAEGRFLIICDSGRKLYAHVCYVRMSQLGNFMMGESHTLKTTKSYGNNHPGPNNLILSGTYGGDGLPACEYEKLTPESQAKMVPLPPDLTEKFWNGGGHNSAGSEGPDLHAWALQTFPARKRR